MKRTKTLTHRFVEYIPRDIQEGTIYISMAFSTAIHKCCCGCGQEVVTPLGRTDWQLTFDGESISLDPSIGNWSFDCKSHYWIRHNKVIWALHWSQKKIDASRAYDKRLKDMYFKSIKERQDKSDRRIKLADRSAERKPSRHLIKRSNGLI